MKVLVIGGTGFIGSYVVKALIERGHEAKVLAKPGSSILHSEIPHFFENIYSLPDEDMLNLLAGLDAFVFAAGVDDRFLPKPPAIDFFMDGNVNISLRIIRLAKQAGLKRAVFMGSYFAHFNRKWPELKLHQVHPYICSREQQEQLCTAMDDPDFNSSFLELPFIFGAVPEGKPMWTPLLKYLKSPLPKFAPRGGTAAVAVETVANVCCAVLEQDAANRLYPVGDENYQWTELYRELARAMGRTVRVYHLPTWVLKTALSLAHFWIRLKGRESGLRFNRLAELLTRELYLDDLNSGSHLNYHGVDLSAAFNATIVSAQIPISNE